MYRIYSVFHSALFCAMIAGSIVKKVKSYMNDVVLK